MLQSCMPRVQQRLRYMQCSAWQVRDINSTSTLCRVKFACAVSAQLPPTCKLLLCLAPAAALALREPGLHDELREGTYELQLRKIETNNAAQDQNHVGIVCKRSPTAAAPRSQPQQRANGRVAFNCNSLNLSTVGRSDAKSLSLRHDDTLA
eukprot:16132-Heterococcus_DN1.PRE.1